MLLFLYLTPLIVLSVILRRASEGIRRVIRVAYSFLFLLGIQGITRLMTVYHPQADKVFEIFETYKTSIDMIATSEVGVSVTIDNQAQLSNIVDELKKYGTVTVDIDMCIVCVVGDLTSQNIGFETLTMDALKQIPVRMISYGGSAHNISFVVAQADKKRTLQALQQTLFQYDGHVRRDV